METCRNLGGVLIAIALDRHQVRNETRMMEPKIWEALLILYPSTKIYNEVTK